MARFTKGGRVLVAAIAAAGWLGSASTGVDAQAVYGSIAGTVLDASGAPVFGATVIITSPAR